MKKIRTHYDNLQVSKLATDIVIRAAFRSLSQKHHPDKNLDNVQNAVRAMKIINEAYAVLSNPKLRKEHDEWIKLNDNSYSESRPKEAKEASNKFSEHSERFNKKTNKHEFDFEPKNRPGTNNYGSRSNKTRSIFDDIESETFKKADSDVKVINIKSKNITPILLIIGCIFIGRYLLFEENSGRGVPLIQEPSVPAQAQYASQSIVPEILQYGIHQNSPDELSLENNATDTQIGDDTLGTNRLSRTELGLMIESSLIFNEETQKNLVDGSDVLKVLVAEGLVSSEPTLSYGYNDYYLVNGEIEVLGSKLIAFNHKYFKEQTSCCANMGGAVLLLIKENLHVIERFAKVNKCKLQKGNSVSLPYEMTKSIDDYNRNISSLILLTCEEDYGKEIDSNSTTISPDLSGKDFELPNQVEPIKADIKTLTDNPKQNKKNCTQAEVALNQCY